jgi:hypothetical protein
MPAQTMWVPLEAAHNGWHLHHAQLQQLYMAQEQELRGSLCLPHLATHQLGPNRLQPNRSHPLLLLARLVRGALQPAEQLLHVLQQARLSQQHHH